MASADVDKISTALKTVKTRKELREILLNGIIELASRAEEGE